MNELLSAIKPTNTSTITNYNHQPPRVTVTPLFVDIQFLVSFGL